MDETFMLRLSDQIPAGEIRKITITPNGGGERSGERSGEGGGERTVRVTLEFSKNPMKESQKQSFPAKLFPMTAPVEVHKRRSTSPSSLLKCANVTQMLHVFHTEEEMTSSSPICKDKKKKRHTPTPENTRQIVQDILSAEQSHTEYAIVDFQPWMIDGFLYTLDEKMTNWNTELESLILTHPETFFSFKEEENAVIAESIDDQELQKVPQVPEPQQHEEIESDDDDDNDWMVHSSDDDDDEEEEDIK